MMENAQIHDPDQGSQSEGSGVSSLVVLGGPKWHVRRIPFRINISGDAHGLGVTCTVATW